MFSTTAPSFVSSRRYRVIPTLWSSISLSNTCHSRVLTCSRPPPKMDFHLRVRRRKARYAERENRSLRLDLGCVCSSGKPSADYRRLCRNRLRGNGNRRNYFRLVAKGTAKRTQKTAQPQWDRDGLSFSVWRLDRS